MDYFNASQILRRTYVNVREDSEKRLVGNRSEDKPMTYLEALEIAYKCVEKFIGVNACQQVSNGVDTYSYISCPVCHTSFGGYENFRPKHCPECGQRLKYEEGE